MGALFWAIIVIGAIAFFIFQELTGWQLLRRLLSSQQQPPQRGGARRERNWRSLMEAERMPTRLFQQVAQAKQRKQGRRSQRDLAGDATRLQPTPGINPREQATQIQINRSAGAPRPKSTPPSPKTYEEEPTRFQPLWEDPNPQPKPAQRPTSQRQKPSSSAGQPPRPQQKPQSQPPAKPAQPEASDTPTQMQNPQANYSDPDRTQIIRKFRLPKDDSGNDQTSY
jgi:hypothetical protein